MLLGKKRKKTRVPKRRLEKPLSRRGGFQFSLGRGSPISPDQGIGKASTYNRKGGASSPSKRQLSVFSLGITSILADEGESVVLRGEFSRGRKKRTLPTPLRGRKEALLYSEEESPLFPDLGGKKKGALYYSFYRRKDGDLLQGVKPANNCPWGKKKRRDLFEEETAYFEKKRGDYLVQGEERPSFPLTRNRHGSLPSLSLLEKEISYRRTNYFSSSGGRGGGHPLLRGGGRGVVGSRLGRCGGRLKGVPSREQGRITLKYRRRRSFD